MVSKSICNFVCIKNDLDLLSRCESNLTYVPTKYPDSDVEHVTCKAKMSKKKICTCTTLGVVSTFMPNTVNFVVLCMSRSPP